MGACGGSLQKSLERGKPAPTCWIAAVSAAEENLTQSPQSSQRNESSYALFEEENIVLR